MDNFRIDITSEGEEQLKAAILLFRRREAVGYSVIDPKHNNKRLLLFWAEPSAYTGLEYHPFPFRMPLDQAANFAATWLAQADYGPQPDHDGDNGKGFRLYNEGWGHVAGMWQAFAAIEPAWAMYGQ